MLFRLSVNKWSVHNWVDVNRESQRCEVRVQRSAVEPGLDFFTPIPRHGRKKSVQIKRQMKSHVVVLYK